MTTLFDPITLGDIQASNRILMAPLTRARATRHHVPTAMMIDYYRLRASAGLIISEGTGISQEGMGWPYAPGIWNQEQIAAWKPVTQAVHDKGGKIICQLWHMGRLVHPSFYPSPISASATTAPHYAYTYDGKKPYAQARALPIKEIPRVLNDFAQAASNAIKAGFDGVQIHAANGYLIDEFLRNGTNLRQDEYGGSIENRIRLLVEVTRTVCQTIGSGKTSVRLSPNEPAQGVFDTNPVPLFTAAARALAEEKIAFLEVREPIKHTNYFAMKDVTDETLYPPISPAMRKAFSGAFVMNSAYNGKTAQEAVKRGDADAIAFGRPYISNPDLVEKIKAGIPFAKDDQKTWYTQGIEGYLDYPLMNEK